MIYYKDEEICIRDILEKDAIRLFAWSLDEEIYKYDPRPIPMNTNDLLKTCQSFCNQFDEKICNIDIAKRSYKYFIIENSDSKQIGFIDIFSYDVIERSAELGIIIGEKDYWKKGIAFKAINLIIDYLFFSDNDMKIEKIFIETAEDNLPARNLFKKLDFTQVGQISDEGFTFVIMEKNKFPLY